jgi:arsenate reductase
LLNEHGIDFEYREYRKDPLSVDELRAVLDRLGLEPRDVLRPRDRAAKALGLTGDESAERLIELMSEHPTLLQRPIGVAGDRAVVGRPPENLLALVDEA